jgi:hypothetical protein
MLRSVRRPLAADPAISDGVSHYRSVGDWWPLSWRHSMPRTSIELIFADIHPWPIDTRFLAIVRRHPIAPYLAFSFFPTSSSFSGGRAAPGMSTGITVITWVCSAWIGANLSLSRPVSSVSLHLPHQCWDVICSLTMSFQMQNRVQWRPLNWSIYAMQPRTQIDFAP